MPFYLPKLTLTHKQISQIHAQIIKTLQPHHTLNPLLKLLATSSIPQNAFPLYNQMLLHPNSHDNYTFNHALRACTFAHAHHKGLEIHGRVIKSGHSSDVFTQNTLLNFYLTEADVTSARKLFGSISCPDVVSWTTIISGLSRCGFGEEAIVMFRSMNVKPNCFTLVSVVSACSGLEAHRLGRAIHAYSVRNLEESNVFLQNALLDLYVRCGSLFSAQLLFEKMPDRDIVSWTTMVGGYAQRGHCEKAFEVFQTLVRGGEAEPNEVTLVSILTACSSIGALSLGRWIHAYINTRENDILMNTSVGNALMNMYVKCGNVSATVSVFDMMKCSDLISWSTVISGLAMNGLGKQVLEVFALMLVTGVVPDDITFVGLLSACSHSGLVDQGEMLFKGMLRFCGTAPRIQHYACMVDMYGRAGLLEEAEALARDMPDNQPDRTIMETLLNACKVHGDVLGARLELQDVKGFGAGAFALLSNTYASLNRWEDAGRIRDEMRCCGLKKMPGCSWIQVDLTMPR